VPASLEVVGMQEICHLTRVHRPGRDKALARSPRSDESCVGVEPPDGDARGRQGGGKRANIGVGIWGTNR
jgi:hypothetical protein